MRRIGVIALSLALLLVSPGLAYADMFTRPVTNQQYINLVIARGLSQRGVPFTYGGGNAEGPTRGIPQPPTTPEPAADGLPVLDQAATIPGLVPAPQVPAPVAAPQVPAQVGSPAQDPGADVVGFDASGLMVYAYAGAGVKLPRSSGEQYKVGQKVLPSQALPGDLIFFGPEGTQSVAMFLGNGQMLEAGDPVVTVSPVRTKNMAPYLVRIIA
ncbi:NlpC/P60 family peptidoglycan-binding protein RipD [Mycolicibacterium palauense]|uniref:NlpC/P60 family peptidoglycan-binding protein RipD n=1 Tax=Mycolicibacterium palauense TaxID=2034511 RepID=UPI000BFED6E7|nr:NlpC/P60 family peptidoglycan-binding protein RipD [Mycolicibacterium palauense]